MWIVNLVMTWVLWKLSDAYFLMDRHFLGWFCVAMSAANAAVVMTELI